MTAPAEALSQRVTLLKKISAFADLSDTNLAILVDGLVPRQFAKNELIFRQGDVSDELYIIIRGKVRLFRVNAIGNETSVSIVTPYDLIGEFGCIDNQPRSSTGKTLAATTLLSLKAKQLVRYMRTMPDLALGLTRHIVYKVRQASAFAEANVQYDAAGRLVHLLLQYNAEFGQEEIPNKRYRVDLSLNQTDLATLIGTRRQWVNQILRGWREKGLIDYDGGKFTILDLPKLAAEGDCDLLNGR